MYIPEERNRNPSLKRISYLQYNHLPHQIVTPYKPQDDCTNSTEPSTPSKICSDRAPLLSPDKRKSTHNSEYSLKS